MNTFSNFYIYTQSLDNQSQDLMYQVTNDQEPKAELITDLAHAQRIMAEMTAIASQKNKINHFLSSKILRDFLVRHDNLTLNIKDKQILFKITTNDTDNLGRKSPIHILLNVSNVQEGQMLAFAEYFQKGFLDFCHQTGRQGKDIDIINNHFIAKILADIQKTPISKTPFLNKNLYVLGILILITVIVFGVLTSTQKSRQDKVQPTEFPATYFDHQDSRNHNQMEQL